MNTLFVTLELLLYINHYFRKICHFVFVLEATFSHRHLLLVTKTIPRRFVHIAKESLKEGQLLHKSRVYCQHISSMAPEFKSDEGTRHCVKLCTPINEGTNTDTIIVLHRIRFKIICR